jgi:hypothetical protein
LGEIVERKGLFCALYSDRGNHFWLTPKLGARSSTTASRKSGRALRDLGVQLIPAYSPQARGRSERNFGTLQGRLPQELRLHVITTLEAANDFLREHYIAEFNLRFQVPAAQPGSAFVPRRSQDLDLIFALQPTQAAQYNADYVVPVKKLESISWSEFHSVRPRSPVKHAGDHECDGGCVGFRLIHLVSIHF